MENFIEQDKMTFDFSSTDYLGFKTSIHKEDISYHEDDISVVLRAFKDFLIISGYRGINEVYVTNDNGQMFSSEC